MYQFHMTIYLITLNVLGQRICRIVVTTNFADTNVTPRNSILKPKLVDLNMTNLTYSSPLCDTYSCTSVSVNSYT